MRNVLPREDYGRGVGNARHNMRRAITKGCGVGGVGNARHNTSCKELWLMFS
jgi:hypothetical protein